MPRNAKKQQAKSDLKPDETGRCDRDKYWSSSLTTRHEKFHITDWQGYHKTECNKFRADVHTHSVGVTLQNLVPADVLSTERGDNNSGFIEKYKNYTDVASVNMYPGAETRAYADGKSSYQELADSIKL